ncbi:PQQ-dependent sugar dehydrogenase [Hirschia litorea]|uniref:PQQ-dependent sugar dehydrogenase n=1 Tax=Hirschia litorea TaxID=1199156 RepID=A0ABW2IPR4_9PROT
MKNGCWEDEEIIFQSKTEHETNKEYHFGSRIEFWDGYLFFSVGDRGEPENVQDLSWPSGKIHRLQYDGRIPKDNPFIDVENAYPSIFSYGHRNPQGLTVGGPDGAFYISEHGPRGGDEINRPEKGKNYGWPIITHGMNYDGTLMTPFTEKEGMEQPMKYWVPSIATAGITSVQSETFPEWEEDILVSGLQSQELHRVRFINGEAVEDEVLIKGIGRVRDVTQSKGGDIFVVMNDDTFGPSSVYRILPISE